MTRPAEVYGLIVNTLEKNWTDFDKDVTENTGNPEDLGPDYVNVSRDECDDKDLFENLCYAVFEASMNTKTLNDKWDQISSVFRNFDVGKVAKMSAREAKKAPFTHKRFSKPVACRDNARRIRIIQQQYDDDKKGFKKYLIETVSHTHEKMEEFSGIGPKESRAFLKYVGFYGYGVADVHTKRVLHRIGLIRNMRFDTVVSKIEDISDKVGKPVAIVDHVIWRFGKGICSRTPRCEVCELRNACRSFATKS